MGRPRKRKLQNMDGPSRESPRQASSAEPNLFDVTIEGLDPFAGQIDFPGLDLRPDIANETGFLTSSASDVHSNQSCACLSSMYLSLDNLRAMNTFSFPSSLYCLREMLATAKSCIDCRLLGTLLLSLAERYNRILKTINSDARIAEESNRVKTLEISGGGTLMPVHDPMGRLGSTEPLVLELIPSEWRKLAKKVVRAEVYGTSDAGRASFKSVLTTLEERQALWHKMEPTDDCPDPERRRQEMYTRNDNPICLTLAREAKKLVELFDFSWE
ncbi:hypothetical protein E4T42_04434 [Aureobasidium subglaciale]|nr:hypothetical protein E4T42_04434 [Aureobasidium subglaciale]